MVHRAKDMLICLSSSIRLKNELSRKIKIIFTCRRKPLYIHTLEASSSYRHVLDKVLKKKSNRLSYQFYKLPAKSCEGKKAFI